MEDESKETKKKERNETLQALNYHAIAIITVMITYPYKLYPYNLPASNTTHGYIAFIAYARQFRRAICLQVISIVFVHWSLSVNETQEKLTII